MVHLNTVVAILFLTSLARIVFAQAPAEPAQTRFARDIRPIFAEHCFTCHGPDKNKRQGDLRLDLESAAKATVEGKAAVVPGDPARSELWKRITSNDPDERMPPPDSGHSLSATQIEQVRAWIEQGAKWESHWSFQPPVKMALPTLKAPGWARNSIDLFIGAKLDSLGLRPSREAARETLIRRVTFDLTGLPPSLDEIDRFVADPSPSAYEMLVERLLASPRYGERMAALWLDGARYADTSGYQNDGPRSMWRWRDWVIDAYNRNLPFDQFTVEQIAGDLLPSATRDQQIATGFNRNHRGNAEGGIIAEEYQVEYVVDRVDTTCTVWLGLTMGCARCHDHKYDPLLQTEFYGIYAFFNNIPEYGRAIKEGNSPPYVSAPTDEQERQLAVLDHDLASAKSRWESLRASLSAAQLAFENSVELSGADSDWSIERGSVARFTFDPPLPVLETKQDTVESGSVPVVIDYRFTGGEACFEPGVFGQAVQLDGQRFIESPDAGNFGYFDRFSVSLWAKPTETAAGTLVSRMTDEEQGDGWYVQLHDGRLQVNLLKRWLDDAIRIETVNRIPAGRWSHIAVVYDGSRKADGIRVYINGQRESFEKHFDFLNQTFATKEPLRIGAGGGAGARFKGALDDVRIFQRCLEETEIGILGTPESIRVIVRTEAEKRTAGQRSKLAAYYLASHAPAHIRRAHEQLLHATETRRLFMEKIPSVMVMREMPQPRDTFVLRRGEYDKPGEKIKPGVPTCLPGLPVNEPASRLAFARWLASSTNPLTARVAMNRTWQMHFGAGLVRTTEDFGAQGDSPSHPDLLDWLAVEFMDRDWDVKALQRLIVTSATYRQASGNNQSLAASDPENRWFTRGPRFRLSAEMIRDQALAMSGLLTEQLGGPSVKPYQPADLWKDLATDNTYDQDHGRNLYRRSLYTYWKRTVAPPAMMTFDAAGRESCQVRSTRTNTPLQALILLNETSYVEAARVMAERIMREGGQAVADRLAFAFRLITSRPPRDAELQVLKSSFESQLTDFKRDPASAERLLSHGEFPRDQSLAAAELAAYATIANLLMNLDEVVTRQ